MRTKKERKNSWILGMAILLIAIAGIACKKFLAINQGNQNEFNPHTVQDFEEMLNNPEIAQPDYFLADMMSDNFFDVGEENRTDIIAEKNIIRFYHWREWDPMSIDLMYNSAYKWIAHMNLVINSIGEAPGGTSERKAMAKINRAYFYLQLANLYGPVYQSSTAATALAVPLVLDHGLSTSTPRATVQAIYAQVLSDLSEAVNTSSLPNLEVENVLKPSKVAAFALLARAYLYMGNYEAALTAATAALDIRHSLIDYQLLSPANEPPYMELRRQTLNPENLLAKTFTYPSSFVSLPEFLFLEPQFAQLFNSKDLRLSSSFKVENLKVTKTEVLTLFQLMIYRSDRTSYSYNYGPNVPEMMLIKAECLARKGDANGAISLLNELRKNRFKAADFLAYETNIDAEAALKLVLEERRRELIITGGLRLFDLKRLNLDPRFKQDLVRKDLKGNVTATLPAGSPRYQIPFSPKLLQANPNIVQNER